MPLSKKMGSKVSRSSLLDDLSLKIVKIDDKPIVISNGHVQWLDEKTELSCWYQQPIIPTHPFGPMTYDQVKWITTRSFNPMELYKEGHKNMTFLNWHISFLDKSDNIFLTIDLLDHIQIFEESIDGDNVKNVTHRYLSGIYPSLKGLFCQPSVF
jgi:hypothetical protein